jgi:hypothetical protein
MLVAHDLETGLAMRPQWGPLNGPQAVSEQRLLEEAIDRLLGCRVQPSNPAPPFLLALFTSWDADQQQLLDVYGRRWYKPICAA